MPNIAKELILTAKEELDESIRKGEEILNQLKSYQITQTNVTLPDGITNFNSTFAQCRYGKKADGEVIIEGLIKGAKNGSFLFTLPVGYRPKYSRIFPLVSNNGSDNIIGAISISNIGEVKLSGNVGSTWASVECSFMAEA